MEEEEEEEEGKGEGKGEVGEIGSREWKRESEVPSQ